jgi:hypothetical protein
LEGGELADVGQLLLLLLARLLPQPDHQARA